MPRTIFDREKDKYRKLRILLNGTFESDERDVEDVGTRIGVCGRQVRNYLKNPEKMTLDKLLRLGCVLDVPIEDLRECIRY